MAWGHAPNIARASRSSHNAVGLIRERIFFTSPKRKRVNRLLYSKITNVLIFLLYIMLKWK